MKEIIVFRMGFFLLLFGYGCSSQHKKVGIDLPTRNKIEFSAPEVTQRTDHADDMSLITDAPVLIRKSAHAAPMLADRTFMSPSLILPAIPPWHVISPLLPTEARDDDDDHHEHKRERVETILFKDSFDTPFDVGLATEKWNYSSLPPWIANDGIATVNNGILTVRSKGTNMLTQKPKFTLTVPQETMPTDTPGQLDRVKWLVYPNHLNSDNNIPGYKAVNGKELVCETWMSGETFGTAGNPFGSAVSGNDDHRLAAFGLGTIDLETFMVFDFFVTNTKIYALYERVAYGRALLGNYDAFGYAIELENRVPSDFHHLEIRYDREKGVVRWFVEDKEQFMVDAIGKRINHKYLTNDQIGDEPDRPLVLNQLACTLGHYTYLDGFLPSKTALVRLSATPDFYYNPITQAPLTFFDELSLLSSRLFGQGVQTQFKKFQVKYVSYK